MSKKAPSGRIVCSGDGKMFIQPIDADGETVHIHDDAGNLIPELLEIRRNDDNTGFVIVEPGGLSHNAVHHQRDASIDGTHGTLYDDQGNLVVEGDPHHYEVQPDDPHFAGVQTDPDDVAATVTSHTDAYEGAA